jgi:hypothetical protein
MPRRNSGSDVMIFLAVVAASLGTTSREVTNNPKKPSGTSVRYSNSAILAVLLMDASALDFAISP